MKSATTVTAFDIKRLLAEKHTADVFVPECKDGPTHSASNLLILDAWAMRKSWANYSTLGYEIKVSKQDFKRDQKWPQYLDVCHEFFFVCPSGLIQGAELPKGVGLIWVSSNGAKLITKVKAEKRETDASKLAELIKYVLMCRVVVGAEDSVRSESRDESWRRLIEDAERRKSLAYFVSEHIRKKFDAQATRLTELDRLVRDANEVKEHIAKLGLKWPPGNYGAWDVKGQIDELAGRLPPGIAATIDRARHQLNQMADVIKGLEEHEDNPKAAE